MVSIATPGYLQPMQGLLASFRLPFAFRGPSTSAVATPAASRSVRTPAAVVAAMAADLMGAHPQPAPLLRAYVDGADELSVVAAPFAPSPKAPPIEPSVRVAAAHLVDPVGLRVVPFRPVTRWPLRRAAARIYDPFRGFPRRSAHLADLMAGPDRDRRTR